MLYDLTDQSTWSVVCVDEWLVGVVYVVDVDRCMVWWLHTIRIEMEWCI